VQLEVHIELAVIGRMTVGIGARLVKYNANICERSVWNCLYFIDICGHTLRRLRSNKMDYFADNAEQVQFAVWLSYIRILTLENLPCQFFS
jgi:hypothetical protein